MEQHVSTRDGIEFLLTQGVTQYTRDYVYIFAASLTPLLFCLLFVSQLPFPENVVKVIIGIGLLTSFFTLGHLIRKNTHELPKIFRFPSVFVDIQYVDPEVELALFDPVGTDREEFKFRIANQEQGWEFRGTRTTTRYFVKDVKPFDPDDEEVDPTSMIEDYGEPDRVANIDFERLSELIEGNSDGSWKLKG